jgi:hypothetical protein
MAIVSRKWRFLGRVIIVTDDLYNRKPMSFSREDYEISTVGRMGKAKKTWPASRRIVELGMLTLDRLSNLGGISVTLFNDVTDLTPTDGNDLLSLDPFECLERRLMVNDQSIDFHILTTGIPQCEV